MRLNPEHSRALPKGWNGLERISSLFPRAALAKPTKIGTMV